jgi:hypothetical protein
VQGRSGKTGIATTFINSRQCSESILLDLKHLLKEAKQRVPQFLTVSSTQLGGSAIIPMCGVPCIRGGGCGQLAAFAAHILSPCRLH